MQRSDADIPLYWLFYCQVQLQEGSGPKEDMWKKRGRKGWMHTWGTRSSSLNQRDSLFTHCIDNANYLVSIRALDLFFTSPLNIQGEKAKYKIDSPMWDNIVGQCLSNQKLQISPDLQSIGPSIFTESV